MSVEFYWRLPLHGCHGDLAKDANRGDWSALRPGNITPGLRRGEPDGFPFVDHAAEIAKAAEIAGFYGALVISFPNTEEAWAVSSALARETKSLHFMIAFQPNFIHPVQAARQAASLQRLSQGRVEWNVITGGGGPAQRWYGDYLPHDDRYRRTDEFLSVVEAEFRGRPYDFHGKIFQVEGGGLPAPLNLERQPRIYLSGSSDSALDVAGKRAEVLLNWLEPDEAIHATIRRIREKAAATGRPLNYGLRVDILARPTEEEAWREIERGWAKLDPDTIRARIQQYAANESVGAARQAALRPQSISGWQDLKTGPNRWGGFGFLRGGQANGLVGSYQQVAERLNEFIEAGITTFVLAGTPHLEEAYRVGEEVLPLLGDIRAGRLLRAAE
jgi:alkanesulfonate monooxygenase